MSFRIKLIDNHALYKIPQCTKEIVKLLVDTGADLNLIKLDALHDDVQVSDTKIFMLQGINDQAVKTMGFTMLTVINGNQSSESEFHVVPTNFPIIGDGILGKPFLTENQIVIDVGKGEITSTLDDVTTVPARCETIIPVDVSDPRIQEHQSILVYAQNINNEIICGNILNKVKNHQILISIINPTETQIVVPIPKLTELSHEIINEESIKHFIHTNKVTENEQNRIQLLKNLLKTDHMNLEEKVSIEELCSEFSDIFFLEGDKITCTDAVYHEIRTPGTTQPIYQRPYRLPYSQKEEIDNQIEKLEKDGIIGPSDSPWNAPLLVVPKKIDDSGGQKYRVVVDFRKLNNLTVGDAFPMPDVNTILDQLGNAKYFSCLDMASGYHQIPMRPEDRQKTGFSTEKGHFEFNRMCFGLKGAPATFQRLMNQVLIGLNGVKSFVYLDDVIVIGTSIKDHENNLRDVFKRFRKYNLQLQPLKCQFLSKEVSYLGHLITDEGIKPDPKKIACVANYNTPTNAKELKSFLGLIGYYRKFIKDFSKISKPLTSLLKKDQQFIWTDVCEDAFQTFRTILTKEPILQFPDFSRPFNITTDASNCAIGGILSQGNIGSDLPISYASRTLNKAEINYNTTEKELLAIIWSVKQFRPYIYGRKFNIITDHKPLSWMFGVKDPGARLTRWRLLLEEYDYSVIYKPGVQNTNADALSRIAVSTTTAITPQSTSEYQKFLEEISQRVIINNNVTETAGNLFDAADEYALGHCVSQDFCMKKGIGLEFRRKYGQIKQLKNQNKRVTEIASLQVNGRTIIYLITKEKHWQKPSNEKMFLTLKNLRIFCDSNKIKKLALPKISCGLDQLDWSEIRTMIRFHFKGSETKVLVFIDDTYTEEDKYKIIEEFHNSPLGGHQGISRTIKRIKQQHTWKGLKKDVQNFISSCQSCQRNKTINKTVKQPMVITTTSSKPFERIFLDIVGPITTSKKGNNYILTLQDDLTKFSAAYPLVSHDANSVSKAFVEGFVCQHGIPESILTDCGTEFMGKILAACCKLLQIDKLNTTPYHPQSNGGLERSHQTLAAYLRHYVDKHLDDWDEYVPYAMFVYNTTVHTTTKHQPYELIYGFSASIPHTLSRTPQPRYNYDDYVFELKQKLQESHKLARENILVSKEKSKEIYDQNRHEINFNVGDRVWIKNHQPKGKLSPKWLGPYLVTQLEDNENVIIQKERKEVKIHINELKPCFP